MERKVGNISIPLSMIVDIMNSEENMDETFKLMNFVNKSVYTHVRIVYLTGIDSEERVFYKEVLFETELELREVVPTLLHRILPGGLSDELKLFIRLRN